MQLTQTIDNIIRQRTSVRTYTKSRIEPQKEKTLEQFLKTLSTGPFQSKMRFRLITANPSDENALKGLGTYGFIKNPAGFIVGAVEESGPKSLEDFGYAMEKLILCATDLGLGTCWLGGSFRKSRFAEAIGLHERESVPAVTPVGNPADKKSLLDSLLRKSAGSDKRMPWEQLFFHDSFTTPLARDCAGSYAVPLDMLRLAPSASNKQPWRVIKETGKTVFHFYLKRTPNFNRSEKKYFRMPDLQRVDLGIAFCHFELTAREQGLHGKWELCEPAMNHLPEHTEYVATWNGE